MAMIEGLRTFGARHAIFRKNFITQIINTEFKICEQSIVVCEQQAISC